jgi:hypothetical protein
MKKKLPAVIGIFFLAVCSLTCEETVSKEKIDLLNTMLSLNDPGFSPCLYLDTSKNNYVTYLSYSDVNKHILTISDNTELYDTQEYVYNNNVLSKIITSKTYKDRVEEEVYCTIRYTLNQVLFQKGNEDSIYKIDNNSITFLSGNEPASCLGYKLMRNNNQYEYWDLWTDYEKRMTYKLVKENCQQEIYDMRSKNNLIMKYKNNILIERTYPQYNSFKIYTIIKGIGQLIEKDAKGNIVSVSQLERRTDEKGFLTYEKVIHSDGSGWEYYIGTELPDRSQIINQAYP